ncbi:DUF4190 domain-containing protein [Litoribacterium kuwaitense]|uniref:DUF4190 domain-containing protein n=1 Tax=Litoribacterium kuwaitense TaxID=1398745 RepID=UPI001FEAA772|nr:DUF4190 domain-containing protein [Litoribacterium kuwaitense]
MEKEQNKDDVQNHIARNHQGYTEENHSYLEETAAEATFADAELMQADAEQEVQQESEADSNATGLSGVALALSIIALLIWPVLLGAAGIIIGFVARRRGAGAMANWAIGIGTVAIVISLFFAPFI